LACFPCFMHYYRNKLNSIANSVISGKYIADLERAGFAARSGKGSHRIFTHKNCTFNVVISGKSGADALSYQEKDLKRALREIKK
jgi:predicted RNA binding protein YcfA (HicA-like mRNA interferase family)